MHYICQILSLQSSYDAILLFPFIMPDNSIAKLIDLMNYPLVSFFFYNDLNPLFEKSAKSMVSLKDLLPG
jgi:hypothetical protein